MQATEVEVSVVDVCKSVCHWCCHPIPESKKMIGIPFRYTGNKYTCIAKPFCSFGCATSYLHKEIRGPMQVKAMSLMPIMYKQMGGSLRRLPRPAPSRDALNMFGGSMSIDEFRQASVTENIRVDVSRAPMEMIDEFVSVSKSSNGDRYKPRLNQRGGPRVAHNAVSTRTEKHPANTNTGGRTGNGIMDFLTTRN